LLFNTEMKRDNRQLFLNYINLVLFLKIKVQKE
jgi:hypothetical protein